MGNPNRPRDMPPETLSDYEYEDEEEKEVAAEIDEKCQIKPVHDVESSNDSARASGDHHVVQSLSDQVEKLL